MLDRKLTARDRYAITGTPGIPGSYSYGPYETYEQAYDALKRLSDDYSIIPLKDFGPDEEEDRDPYLKITAVEGAVDIRGNERGLNALRAMIEEALRSGSYFVEAEGQEVLVLKVNG